MKNVLLISEADLKNNSVIEKNVDGKMLSKLIRTVQDTQLRPVLGDTLYTEIIDAVYANATESTAITTSMRTLLDSYVKPFLTYAVTADFIVLNYKFTNKGVLKLSDNSGQNVSSQELEYLRNYYENYSATYKRMLVDYLHENNLVESGEVDTDITSPSIGWFLGTGVEKHVHSQSNGSLNYTKAEIDALLANFYSKTEVDALVSGMDFSDVQLVETGQNLVIGSSDTHIVITANSTSPDITLPSAADNINRRIIIKNWGTQSANIYPGIKVSPMMEVTFLFSGKWVEVVSNGTKWVVTSGN